MKKLKEGALMMWYAARYSLSFCLKYNRKDTIVRLFISALSTVVLYLTIQATGMMINSVQHARGNVQVLWLPVGFFIGVQFFDLLLTRAHTFYQSKWGHELRSANTQDLNTHRGSLDVACHKSKRYDDLDKQIRELPFGWYTRVNFSEQMLTLFSLAISFCLFGISLVWYKPLYALVLLAMAIPKVVSEFSLVAMWWNMYERHIPHYKTQDMLSRPFKSPVAFVQAKIFNQMEPLGELIWSREIRVIDEYNEARHKAGSKKTFTSLLTLLGLLAVILHASWTAIITAGAIGTLSIVIASARTFQGNLNSIVMLMADQWNSAKGVLLIERDFKGLKPMLVTLDPIVPEFTNPHIRFDRVSFAYPAEPAKEVLHEVSFEIEAGSKVAIVGKSGNGKSTIQHLLMRHFDPTKGAIYADDINLQNIEPRVWNNFASSLTQSYTIHERLVGEEIASSRLGEPIDKDSVIASANFAHFHEVALEDPDGYEKQIGSDFDGREFSGGEEQRLSLARVHYRNSPILILDEPDARLDPESAQKIMDNVFAIKDRTVIIITHHVSRAEQCDKVIVMGKGVVAEQGSPTDLLAKGGMYAKLCESDKKRLGISAEA